MLTFDCGDKKYRVNFEHCNLISINDDGKQCNGYTTARLEAFETAEWKSLGQEATAYCSLEDQFNKARGRKVALTKLLNKEFSREQRKEIWKQIFFRSAAMRFVRNPEEQLPDGGPRFTLADNGDIEDHLLQKFLIVSKNKRHAV